MMKLARVIGDLIQLLYLMVSELLNWFNLYYNYVNNEWVEFTDIADALAETQSDLEVPDLLRDLPPVVSKSQTNQYEMESTDILLNSKNPSLLNKVPICF